MKYAISFCLLLICISCSNKENFKSNKKITLTKYEFLKDSTEVVSIFNTTTSTRRKPINYQEFKGKFLMVSFKNNSTENIYLTRLFQQDTADKLSRKFTASVTLLQQSNDSIKWESVIHRGAVDTYDIYYDTIIPNTILSKLVYLDNYKNEKFLELLIKYKSDSMFYNDTVRIKNNLP